MDADFNTPDALAVIFDLAREINRFRDAGAESDELDRRRRTVVYLLDILGLDLRSEVPADDHAIDTELVELLLDQRRKARELKQWAQADALRTRLTELGVVVEDKPGGESTWRLDR
jgi:cysteinyl-tRNA synthetase